VIWAYGLRGLWDHALMESALDGSLWPGVVRPCVDIVHADPTRCAPDAQNGAVLIGAWGGFVERERLDKAHTKGYCAEIKAATDALPWCLFVQTSDEQVALPPPTQRARLRHWLMSSRPGRPADRRVLLGWPPGTREILADLPRLPLAERRHRWFFSGQVNHKARLDTVAALEKRKDGLLQPTGGFTQGHRPTFLRDMASCAIAPCPGGWMTPETFRLYEALEAGCVPICSRDAPLWPAGDRGDYWQHVLGCQPPFPVLDDWTNLGETIDRLLADPVELQRLASRCGAWWIGYKRSVAVALEQDLAALTGQASSIPPVTVLVPTSSVISNPSTAYLENTIRRIRSYAELRDAELIIQIDGLPDVHADRRAAYEEYKRRVIDLCAWDPEFRGCLPLVFEEHTHQANMARAALDLVRTPLVMYCEHDIHPAGVIDWAGMIRLLGQPGFNAIRLHGHESVLPCHAHLFGPVQEIDGVPVMRTSAWWHRPHLARTRWYTHIVNAIFGRDAKTMIEDVLYQVMAVQIASGEATIETWGVWVYAPNLPRCDDGPQGMLRSIHTNAREYEPKLPMVFAYDGARPSGAPLPGSGR